MTLTLHAQAEELRGRIRELRRVLLWCQEEWYSTSVVLRERLTGAYNAAFGDIEADIQQLALEHAELFRRVEILTIKHERGEVITADIVDHVNHLVDREYRRFRERIRPVASRSTMAMEESHRNGLHEEVVHLFRVVAKRLHPDLSTDRSNDDLWHRARRAYEDGDVRTLRAIEQGTASVDVAEESGDVETLQALVNRLDGRIAAEQKKLARLRTEEPFSLEHVIDDEQWRQFHRTTLEHQRAAWHRAIEQARQRYAELTSNAGMPNSTQHGVAPANDEDAVNDDDFMERTYLGFR